MPEGIFLLAELSEAKSIAKQALKAAPSGAACLPGMNMIDLVTLAQTLDPSSDHMYLITAMVRAGTGAALSLPSPLCLRLAKLEKEEIPRIADTWSKEESFRGMFEPVELAAFLRDLSTLARQATAAERTLLFLNI